MPRVRALLVVPAGCLVATCTSAGSAVGPKVATTATDSNCEVATTSLAVDRTTFAVTKQGPEVTESYMAIILTCGYGVRLGSDLLIRSSARCTVAHR